MKTPSVQLDFHWEISAVHQRVTHVVEPAAAPW